MSVSKGNWVYLYERIAQLFPTNIEDNLKGELDKTNTQETTCRWFINNTHTHTHTHVRTRARTHTQRKCQIRM